MEEVPRRTSLVPLAFPCFVLCLIGVETEGLLDYQGRAGDHFHCTVEPSPGHISASTNVLSEVLAVFRSKKNSLNIKLLGGMFLGHPGSRRRDIPDKNFMQVAFFCCFRHGVAGISRDLGRDVPDLERLIPNYRYRIVPPEDLISITETDLWECQHKISHYKYRFSLLS